MSALVIANDEKDIRKVAFVANQLAQGRSNAVGTFTLSTGSTTTTVAAPNCGDGSTVLPFQRTANAAAEIGNGTMYIGTVSNGSFVVTHASNGQTDRTFMYVALG